MTNETLPFSAERIEAERAAYQRWQKRRDEAIKSAAVMEISEGISLALLFNPMFERCMGEQVNGESFAGDIRDSVLGESDRDCVDNAFHLHGGSGRAVPGGTPADDSGDDDLSDRWGRVNHITFYLFVPAILIYFAGACCMPSLVVPVAIVAGLVAVVGGYAAWKGWMPL